VTAVPTLLVIGFSGAGKSRLFGRWLAARPANERWAWLLGGFPDPAGPGGNGAPSDPDDAVGFAHLAGACACCTAGPAFVTTLNRLLRQGPWDRLFIEASPQAHPAALMDRLLSPPLSSHLRLLSPLLVIDPARLSPYADPGHAAHALAGEQLEVARTVIFSPREYEGAPEPDTTLPVEMTGQLARADSLAAFWPPTVVSAADAPPGALPDHPPAMVREPPGGPISWHFAPTQVFNRAGLQRALDGLLGPGGALRAAEWVRVTAVFRTGREWVRREWLLTDEALLGDTTSKGSPGWRSSDWRHDSRLEVLAKAPVDPTLVREVLSAHILSD
jgi:hypothetical protein